MSFMDGLNLPQLLWEWFLIRKIRTHLTQKNKNTSYNPNLAHIYEWHISTSTSIAMGLSNWLVSGLLTHYVRIKIHLLTS